MFSVEAENLEAGSMRASKLVKFSSINREQTQEGSYDETSGVYNDGRFEVPGTWRFDQPSGGK